MLSSQPIPRRIVIEKDIRSCSFSYRFSTKFPAELRGIIAPDEYVDAIKNINNAGWRTLSEKFLITFGWILGILGIVLIIPCCLGLILIGYVYSRVDRRVNNLLTALSVKHTTKLRVKFIWRMETIVISTGDKNEIDTVRKYLIIEIYDDSYSLQRMASAPKSKVYHV